MRGTGKGNVREGEGKCEGRGRESRGKRFRREGKGGKRIPLFF